MGMGFQRGDEYLKHLFSLGDYNMILLLAMLCWFVPSSAWAIKGTWDPHVLQKSSKPLPF